MKTSALHVENNHFLRQIWHLKLLLAGMAVLLLSACMPMGDQTVNHELFKDKQDMQVRASQLRPGMPKQAVFQQLGIDPDKFEFMSTEQVQMSVYGNSQIQGSVEELERFKQRILNYEGYALPYRNVSSNGSLGFGKMKVHKTGHDLKLVLIFERDKLLKASVEGQQQVNQKEDQYIWDSLVRKGIFSVF